MSKREKKEEHAEELKDAEDYLHTLFQGRVSLASFHRDLYTLISCRLEEILAASQLKVCNCIAGTCEGNCPRAFCSYGERLAKAHVAGEARYLAEQASAEKAKCDCKHAANLAAEVAVIATHEALAAANSAFDSFFHIRMRLHHQSQRRAGMDKLHFKDKWRERYEKAESERQQWLSQVRLQAAKRCE